MPDLVLIPRRFLTPRPCARLAQVACATHCLFASLLLLVAPRVTAQSVPAEADRASIAVTVGRHELVGRSALLLGGHGVLQLSERLAIGLSGYGSRDDHRVRSLAYGGVTVAASARLIGSARFTARSLVAVGALGSGTRQLAMQRDAFVAWQPGGSAEIAVAPGARLGLDLDWRFVAGVSRTAAGNASISGRIVAVRLTLGAP